MNRIDRMFGEKKGGILSVYLTAGYPGLEDTLPALVELEKAGADMIEIGMPFSDPLADGPVLQECNRKALENGMTLKLLFEQLQNVRDHVSVPLILMGYLNPVLNYGVEAFCRKAAGTGIDGIILPDLPVTEYKIDFREAIEAAGLNMVFLVTPQTSPSRMKEIMETTRGFVYMVSASATTGMRKGFTRAQLAYFRRVRAMAPDVPRMIGFGISTREDFHQACRYAEGAIIGSAFMKHISQTGPLSGNIASFLAGIK